LEDRKEKNITMTLDELRTKHNLVYIPYELRLALEKEYIREINIKITKRGTKCIE